MRNLKDGTTCDGLPIWAIQQLNAEDLERQAAVLREESVSARCPVYDSGDAQCTADRWPAHEHRHDEKELPT
jgi:hypothetical protein